MVKASSQLRMKAATAVAAIALFFFVYLLLTAAAVGITVVCGWAGLQLILHMRSLFMLLIGVGLMAFGLMILFFILKFVFSWVKSNRPNQIRVTAKEQPQLFALLKEITRKTGTHFPKKVFLSPDINASVYFASEFWSMFFPVRKNLVIGMGLINITTTLELTAIIAHEFGHFSQRSMKVGSYAFNVNRVIYNLLYENDTYTRIFGTFAQGSQYFAIFVFLAFKLIAGIQWILQKMHILINITEKALSREMEFHADAVAAYVAGPAAFERALARLEYASPMFDEVIGFYQTDLRPMDIYSDHLILMSWDARKNKIAISGSLPTITVNELIKQNPSKLRINADFATHPETSERIRRVNELQFMNGPDDGLAAISLINNADKVKSELAVLLLPQAEKEPRYIDSETFLEMFNQKLQKDALPVVFNGYFYARNPFEGVDLEEIIQQNAETFGLTANKLFSDEIVKLAKTVQLMQMELSYLQNIDAKSNIRSIMYDGVRYKPGKLSELITMLEKKLAPMQAVLLENDRKIYAYFLQSAENQDRLEQYKSLAIALKVADSDYDRHQALLNDMQQAVTFFSEDNDQNTIRFKSLKLEAVEPQFKSAIQELLTPENRTMIEPEEIKNIELYFSNDWKYVGVTKYHEQNISMLYQAMNTFSGLLSSNYLSKKRNLLEFAAEMMTTSSVTLNPVGESVQS